MRQAATMRATESIRSGAAALPGRAAGMDRTAATAPVVTARGAVVAGTHHIPAATGPTAARLMAAATGHGAEIRVARRAAGTATRAIIRRKCTNTYSPLRKSPSF